MVPADHPVRIIWGFVCGSDLSELADKIRATEDRPRGNRGQTVT